MSADARLSRPTMVPVAAGMGLPIFEWTPSGDQEQWGLLLQTAGTSLTEAEMAAVLRAFCGPSRHLYVLSTRFAEPSFAAAQHVKALIESGRAVASLNVQEASPCYNPNTDNINYQEVAVDDQRERDDRWLLVWQAFAACAFSTGGCMIQIVDAGLGLSPMQHAEERHARLLDLAVVAVSVEQLASLTANASSLPTAASPDEAAVAERRVWPLVAPLHPTRLHGVPGIPELLEQRPEVMDELCGALIGDGSTDALSLTATGVLGTAGLGKTTAATCLVHDARVQTHFSDGIVWLVFGQEREALGNLRELADALGMSREASDGLRDERDAINRLKLLLDRKRVLIVLDDVWDYRRQAKPFKGLLTASNATQRFGKLLLTTRVREVATSAGNLKELTQCSEAVALRMLAKYMLTPNADLSSDGDAKRLVKMSGGLPIAIEQWGVACRSPGGQSMASLVDELNKAKAGMELLEVDASGDYNYGTFFAGLEVQLARLEGSSRQADHELARCYCLLAVLQEDAQMPIDVARQLWSTGEPISEVSATRIARELAGQQLLKLHEEREGELKVSLLDLHRQYIVHRSRSSLPRWQAALLTTCAVPVVPAQHMYWTANAMVHHLRHADFTGIENNGELALLKELDLGSPQRSNDIGDAGAAPIAWLLQRSAQLRLLNLTKVGDSGITILAVALQKNASLQKLSLSWCTMGDASTASLMVALETNVMLQQLSLCYNKVGPVGAASLAAMLQRNTTLQTLNMYGNEVGAAGAASFAAALAKNTTLKELNLGNNAVGDEGAGYFAAALKKNTTLLMLSLHRNGVSATGTTWIEEALQQDVHTYQCVRDRVYQALPNVQFPLPSGRPRVLGLSDVPVGKDWYGPPQSPETKDPRVSRFEKFDGAHRSSSSYHAAESICSQGGLSFQDKDYLDGPFQCENLDCNSFEMYVEMGSVGNYYASCSKCSYQSGW